MKYPYGWSKVAEYHVGPFCHASDHPSDVLNPLFPRVGNCGRTRWKTADGESPERNDVEGFCRTGPPDDKSLRGSPQTL